MSRSITIHVPDIGDVENVDVIEVLVSPGDRVEVEDSLVALESDKASMEIPSPEAGVVREVLVAPGTKVSQGTPILRLELADAAAERGGEAPGTQPGERREAHEAASAPPEQAARATQTRDAAQPSERGAPADIHADVLVLGAGPGGYTAAFRAADLGRRVVLVERDARLGGVCLNVGCIPSKALLHAAGVITQAAALAAHGVDFGAPHLDFAALRAHKDEVVARLTGGLAKLAAQRKVEVLTGTGRFVGPQRAVVETAKGERSIAFEHAILAVGSRPRTLSGLPDDPRVLDSTSALEVEASVERLLVIGGGVIGLEMATVYDALGAQVSVVEVLPELLAGVDPDLVRPLQRRIQKRYTGIYLETQVSGVEAAHDGLHVRFEGAKAPEAAVFDRVLVAVGRASNADGAALERAGVQVDAHGFVAVDQKLRTNVPHIFAIGDVTGPPLLAHRAMHQGRIAAEVIAGLPAAFDAKSVPSVAYTDPEVAWTGLTARAAQAQGVEVEKSVFPWAASGRALGMARSEGATMLLFAAGAGPLLGAGIVGSHAGELIAEAGLAIELGADAEDLALTVHPHPTLSETLGLAAEMATGSITDLMPPRRRR
jgi:dihydrolipoyl dehydrogenase